MDLIQQTVTLDAEETLLPTNHLVTNDQHPVTKTTKYVLLHDLNHHKEDALFKLIQGFYDRNLETIPSLKKHSVADVALFFLELGLEYAEHGCPRDVKGELTHFLEKREKGIETLLIGQEAHNRLYAMRG